MNVTHIAIAITTTSLALGTASPAVLGCALLGSQFPDLDTTRSMFGKVLYPIASYIEQRYAHRTITHSFISTFAIAILFAPLWVVFGWQYWAALVLGQFTGWFADCFTKAGCAAFFPNPARLVIPGNPKARLSSGSSTEYWILGMVILLAIASVNISSAGGISESFATAFFNDSTTTANLFHKYGSSRTVSVDVVGMNARTSRAVSDSFTVLEAAGTDIVGESKTDGRVYRIGSSPFVQVQPTSVKTHIGSAIAIKISEQNLAEIAVSDWLKRLPQNSYLSGGLLLDEMGELRLNPAIGEFPSVRVFGGQLELNNARPSDLIALREFYILSGRVVVKVR